MVDLGTPSKSSGRQNGTQYRPSGAELSKSAISVCGGGGFASQLVFPETIMITVPFGPGGFEKVIFVDGD